MAWHDLRQEFKFLGGKASSDFLLAKKCNVSVLIAASRGEIQCAMAVRSGSRYFCPYVVGYAMASMEPFGVMSKISFWSFGLVSFCLKKTPNIPEGCPYMSHRGAYGSVDAVVL